MSIVKASLIVFHRILAFVFPSLLTLTVTIVFIELLGNVRVDGAESLSLCRVKITAVTPRTPPPGTDSTDCTATYSPGMLNNSNMISRGDGGERGKKW